MSPEREGSKEVEIHTDGACLGNPGPGGWAALFCFRGREREQDLWQRLQQAASRHVVDWRWVKGHSGDPGNDRVDELARAQALALKG